MKQVFILHGGDSFSSYEAYLDQLKATTIDYEHLEPKQSWKHWLATQLPDTDVLLPSLPNSDNAVYDEWKIYFEKLLPFFGDDVQLVGHSLGAMFLAKYLHEQPLPQKIKQLILVAGGYDDDTHEDLGSFKVTSATGLELSADEIHLFHSEDDPVVPYGELAKFERDVPSAQVHTFTDRGHFLDSEFPELLELLQKN